MSSTENGKMVLVELPSELHKLYCWKVRNGSSVRAGETLALAKLKTHGEDAKAAAAPSAESSKPQHKRPSRRKRPAPISNANNIVSAAAPPSDKQEQNSTDIAPNSSKKPAPHEAAVPAKREGKEKPTLDPIVSKGNGIIRMSRPEGCENSLVLGFVEPCQHPTIVANLCAVCGQSANAGKNASNDQTNAETGQSKMSRVTVAGWTVDISESEGKRMAEQDAERLRGQRKLSLVLDLDHTLVHATNDGRAQTYLQDRDDVRSLVLPMMTGEQQRPGAPHRWMQHFVKLRPHLKEFLETALSLYEVGVYTAGTREYAEEIVMILARHLVGARRDRMELDRLRQQVAASVAEMGRINVKGGIHAEENGTVDETNVVVNGYKKEPPKDDDLEQQDDTQGPKPKRRKVTFGEVPTTEKTDHITTEKLEELQTELEEAERLETEAQEMRQRLFGSRVVSRTDVSDLGSDVKSLKRIFPCGGNMAVVVDDREDVWAKGTEKKEPPENPLLVRPYHWQSFLGFADVNNSAGSDPTALDQNEVTSSATSKETDEQLLWTSSILKRLHQRFYAAESPSRQTVMDTLRHMRREVLTGGKIVLSGLIPLHKQLSRPNTHRPSLVRYAEELGAKVQWTVDESVTHVVAANDGTDKIMAARTVRGCFIVKVSWLMECFWSITRRDEGRHLLGAPPKENRVLPMGNSRLENASSSSDDEDDEDLAAEFEIAMTH